jgi:hypothetical protein
LQPLERLELLLGLGPLLRRASPLRRRRRLGLWKSLRRLSLSLSLTLSV